MVWMTLPWRRESRANSSLRETAPPSGGARPHYGILFPPITRAHAREATRAPGTTTGGSLPTGYNLFMKSRTPIDWMRLKSFFNFNHSN